MWYMNIQCDIVNATRRPDIVIANKMEKTAIIIDVVCGNTWEKQQKTQQNLKKRDSDTFEKQQNFKIISNGLEKQQNLNKEIRTLLNLKKINVILVVLGALGSVTKNFEKYVNKENHIIMGSKHTENQNANKEERIDKEPLVIGYNQLPC